MSESTGAISFDLGAKKKKKKNVTISKEEPESAVAPSEEKPTEPVGVSEETGATDESNAAATFSLSLLKKKKKKKAAAVEEDGADETAGPDDSSSAAAVSRDASGASLDADFKAAMDNEDAMEDDDEKTGGADGDSSAAAMNASASARIVRTGDSLFGEGAATDGSSPTNNNTAATTLTAHNQVYAKMLDRVYDILKEKNPELVGGRRKWAPIGAKVAREGSKKTAIYNFYNVCDHLRRDNTHFLNYLLSELATTGSIDGNNRLIVRGRFTDKNINSVIKKYCADYVLCNNCKSHETILVKENRLTFLKCESCGASRSVSAIKAGFQAQTSRRKNQAA